MVPWYPDSERLRSSTMAPRCDPDPHLIIAIGIVAFADCDPQ
jgi:hypothetical protein